MDSRLARLLPALLALWLAFAAWDSSVRDAPSPAASSPPRPPSLTSGMFPLRDGGDARLDPVRDPFDRPRPATAAPEAEAAPAEEPAEPPPAPPPAPVPVFVLEALLVVEGGGGARICGQDLLVGEAIEGLDAADPPVLLRVERGAAIVSHRGVEHRLELAAGGRTP